MAADPQLSTEQKIKTVTFIIFAFVGLVWFCSDGDSAEEEKQRVASLTPEQQRKEKIEKAFSAWDGSHNELTKVIKKSMHNPDSYDHNETKYWDMEDHLIVQTSFRGTNAFGGVVLNTIKAKCSLSGQVIEIIEEP